MKRILVIKLGALGDFAQARVENAVRLDLAHRCGDRGQEAAALSALGFASVWAHDFTRAVEESRAAITLAQPLEEKRALARARLNLVMVHGVTGHLADARTELGYHDVRPSGRQTCPASS